MDKYIYKNIGKAPVSAFDIASCLDNGRLCPVELVEKIFDSIKSSDPAIFTELLEERAYKEARSSSERRRKGYQLSPFDGVPVAWKDLFDIQGRTTTAGSVVLKSRDPASYDAEIVNNATRAGLISIGCLNMTEFAYSGLGLNPHYGTPRNPHGQGPNRIPGGSSSGCGVAVARGLTPLAIGSDTGGSIRIPAALNGIVGFKGSNRAFPRKGTFPLSPTLDTFGPLAADVKSCIGASAVLNGQEINLLESISIKKLNFFIPTNIVFDEIESAVLKNFEGCVRLLEKSGATITRGILKEFDEIERISSNHGYLVGPEALDLHWDLVNSEFSRQVDPRVLNRIISAGNMSARDLIVILRERDRLIQKSYENIGDQIVLFPTTPITAPEIEPLERDDELYIATNKLMLRNTSFGNFLDWCGISLPSGFDNKRMPTSILLSMNGGQEEKLLSVALSVENILNKQPIEEGF